MTRARLTLLIIAVLAIVAPAAVAAQQAADASTVTAIRAGALFDGTSESLTRDVTIVVRDCDGRVLAFGQ